MRWTRWCRQTSDAHADGEVVWSWRPNAGAKVAGSIPRTTVTTKHGLTGESAKETVKTIAQGMPVIRLDL
jgi:hypothetical protein